MAAVTKKEHWAKLYRRVLFEGDRNKLALMLEQAHQAVQRRVRELRSSPTQDQNGKERRDLDAAAPISISCGLLKPSSIGLVRHNRPSREGLPQGMDFGNIRGHGGLAKSSKSTQPSDQGRPESQQRESEASKGGNRWVLRRIPG